MNKTIEETILNGQLPVFAKSSTKRCFVYMPGYELTEVGIDKEKFMIPYFRIKKDEVKNWLDKLLLMPPNPLQQYEGIILSYFDQDGAEPRFGAAIYAI